MGNTREDPYELAVNWAAHRFDSAPILPLSTLHTKYAKVDGSFFSARFISYRFSKNFTHLATDYNELLPLAVVLVVKGDAMIASLIAFIISMDFLCMEHGFLATTITPSRRRWGRKVRTQENLNHNVHPFIRPHSHCDLKSAFQFCSGIQVMRIEIDIQKVRGISITIHFIIAFVCDALFAWTRNRRTRSLEHTLKEGKLWNKTFLRVEYRHGVQWNVEICWWNFMI